MMSALPIAGPQVGSPEPVGPGAPHSQAAAPASSFGALLQREVHQAGVGSATPGEVGKSSPAATKGSGRNRHPGGEGKGAKGVARRQRGRLVQPPLAPLLPVTGLPAEHPLGGQSPKGTAPGEGRPSAAGALAAQGQGVGSRETLPLAQGIPLTSPALPGGRFAPLPPPGAAVAVDRGQGKGTPTPLPLAMGPASPSPVAGRRAAATRLPVPPVDGERLPTTAGGSPWRIPPGTPAVPLAGGNGVPGPNGAVAAAPSRQKGSALALRTPAVPGGDARGSPVAGFPPSVGGGSLRARVAGQVGRGLVRAVQGGPTRVRLVLNPPSLGRVTLVVARRGNAVRAILHVENPVVQDLLRSGLSSLQGLLERQGSPPLLAQVLVAGAPTAQGSPGDSGAGGQARGRSRRVRMAARSPRSSGTWRPLLASVGNAEPSAKGGALP